MEKVKLLKEVAMVFEQAKGVYNERDIIRRAASGGFPTEYKSLNGVLPEILVRAYYFGYEIETPDDIIKKLYLEYYGTGELGGHVTKAIKKTLDALNIRVHGIN
jgi:hypothetical protein